MKYQFFLAALAAGSLLAAPAHASDGVIEINAAKAVAAGGYPYVISQPGSYRLTSNLVQPDKDTDVIQVEAANVTIDLNGFAITGPNVCTWHGGISPYVSCTQVALGSSGYGINGGSGAATGLTIRNGSVSGVGATCVYAPNGNALLQDLVVSHCGGDGVKIAGGLVSRVGATYNFYNGIFASAPIADSTARFNGRYGIGSYSTVRHSEASQNAQAGILSGGSVIGNMMVGNGGAGLAVSASTSFSGNVLYTNNNGGAQIANSGGAFLLNGGGNVCEDTACP